MRGKLRDKRATAKHDVFKSGAAERKRIKHTLTHWLNPDADEQDDELFEDENEVEAVVTILPQPEKK